MQLKAKRIDKLQEKLKEFENQLVVKYLNKRGYECNTSRLSMIRVNKVIKSENKRVVIERQNEKLLKSGSYYIWDGFLKIKFVDAFTGKEV